MPWKVQTGSKVVSSQESELWKKDIKLKILTFTEVVNNVKKKKKEECLVTPLLVVKIRNGKNRHTWPKTGKIFFKKYFFCEWFKNPEKVLRGKRNNRNNNNKNNNTTFTLHYEI